MKLVFNRSLTGKCFSGNKFRAIINRRRGFELLFFGGERHASVIFGGIGGWGCEVWGCSTWQGSAACRRIKLALIHQRQRAL